MALANGAAGKKAGQADLFKRQEFSWRTIQHPLAGNLQSDGNGGVYSTTDLSGMAMRSFELQSKQATLQKEYYQKLNAVLNGPSNVGVSGSLMDKYWPGSAKGLTSFRNHIRNKSIMAILYLHVERDS